MRVRTGLAASELLTLAGLAAVGWWLSRRISPVEESYRLGYWAGYREGRESESLSVVPLRKVS